MKYIIFFLIFTFPIISSEEFIGSPQFLVFSSTKGVQKNNLSAKEKKDGLLIIRKNEDGDYIWVTRGNNILNKSVSGIFIIYFATSGAGYIKIDSTSGQYIEHMSLGLETYTYYGTELSLK